jgi:hypothetical protein
LDLVTELLVRSLCSIALQTCHCRTVNQHGILASTDRYREQIKSQRIVNCCVILGRLPRGVHHQQHFGIWNGNKENSLGGSGSEISTQFHEENTLREGDMTSGLRPQNVRRLQYFARHKMRRECLHAAILDRKIET